MEIKMFLLISHSVLDRLALIISHLVLLFAPDERVAGKPRQHKGGFPFKGRLFGTSCECAYSVSH